MPNFITAKVADNIGISFGILIAMFACRFAAEWAVSRKSDRLVARQRRFTVRAVANLLVAFALLAVWMSEIQNLVFSLAAVMVALVIATKELIMCIAGAVLRLGGQLFKVGDRIEIGGMHGEVVDHGLFPTTERELPAHGPGHLSTGRRLTLPNSILLSATVRVEAQPRQFAAHRFAIVLDQPVPVGPAVERLNEAAGAAIAADADRAARFHRMATARLGTEVSGPGHEVSVTTTEIGKIQFNVMLYCLVKDARDLQQAITLAFLSEITATGNAVPQNSAAADIWPEIARRLTPPPLRANAA